MDSLNIIEKLRDMKPVLKEQFGIEDFAVFGSIARGENSSNSDVDIVVLKSSKKNLIVRLKTIEFLEKKLNKKVDLGYYDGLKSIIKRKIEKDLIRV